MKVTKFPLVPQVKKYFIDKGFGTNCKQDKFRILYFVVISTNSF